MISKASLDNIFSTSWHKASDRGDPARYVGNERGEENPGRGCGIRPAGQIAPRNLLQLSASASNAPTDNPPPATEARPRQEDFFLAPFRLPPEPPKRAPYPCDPFSSDPAGKRKRRGPSKPAAATEEPQVKPTVVSRGGRRRFPRNLRRMQRLLNKSVVRSRPHLGQGRVKQGQGKIPEDKGRSAYHKRATSSAGTVDRASKRRESWWDNMRLPRAVTLWLPRNSRALDPESINCSKLP